MNYFQFFGCLVVGIASGLIGAIAGGGGLLSIPFLIFLGVPPQITLATNKFSGLGMSAGATFKFIKERKVVWKFALVLVVAGVSASFIGARILITTDQMLLQKMIGVLLLLLTPTIFFKPSFGLKKIKVSNSKMVVGTIIYFALSILASFFGGIGMLMIPTVIYFFGLQFIEANATDLIGFSLLSLSASIIFMVHGLVNYYFGFILMAGMLLGGYIGAHIAIQKGDKFVKIVFALVVIASALKILIK